MPKPPVKSRESKAPVVLVPNPKPLAHRLSRLDALFGKLVEVPSDWLSGAISTSKKGSSESITPCDNYASLKESWEKALRWTDGLDVALSAMLASVTSTMSVGCQLWLKILGPPSCGKSTLCEALSMNKEYVLAKSTLRGFHSGFGDEGEDNSLLAKVHGKTLVTKDGDTLLQSPNLNQILSEARDVYDTVSRSSYRNRNSRDYENVRMTWLLCGTSSLKAIDSSELGERFLDCVIMSAIDDDVEDEILLAVAAKADRNLAIEANGEAASQYDPDLGVAMRLTGGYVKYLRENAQELLAGVDFSEDRRRYVARLGKFVAYMRARPSKIQDEKAEREFAARLVEQHVRLAKCVAVVLNKTEVDNEVIRRTRKIAWDTSQGPVLTLVQTMMKHQDGLNARSIASYVDQPDVETQKLLRFLRMLGVVEKTINPDPRLRQELWKLTGRIVRLYRDLTVKPKGQNHG